MKSFTEYINDLKTIEDKGVYIIRSIEDKKFISYSRLYENAIKIGWWLRSEGIGHGNELIIMVKELESFINLFWGCIICGIKAIPVKFVKDSMDMIKTSIDICNDKYIVTDDKNIYRKIKESFSHYEDFKNVFYSLDLSDKISYPLIFPEYRHMDESVLYILFSSGSTSGTKGVEINSKGLIENMLSIAERSDITEKDSMLGWISLYHAFGLSNTHLISVICKIDQYLLPTDVFMKDPLILFHLIDKYNISLSAVTNFSVNFILKILTSDSKKYNWNLSSLRILYNASEPVSASVCREFYSKLKRYGYKSNVMKPSYGMTESVSLITIPMIEDKIISYDADKECLKIGLDLKKAIPGKSDFISVTSLGYPLSGMKVRVTDLNDNDLGQETVGIIQLAGSSIIKKYYSFEEDALKNGWFNTGDIGFIHKDQVYITSRFKFMFIYNGKSYYCNELEEYMVTKKFADKNTVFFIGYRKNQEDINDSILCFIKYNNEIDMTLAKKADAVITELERTYGIIISCIIPTQNIPKSDTGKVQRFKMQESYLIGELDHNINKIKNLIKNLKKDSKSVFGKIKDKSDIEIILEEILLDKLNMDIDISRNFISMGLTSINLTQFLSLVDKIFKIELVISDMFEYPNIQLLSEFIYDKLYRAERK